jgi:hypothetical protein
MERNGFQFFEACWHYLSRQLVHVVLKRPQLTKRLLPTQDGHDVDRGKLPRLGGKIGIGHCPPAGDSRQTSPCPIVALLSKGCTHPSLGRQLVKAV